jgi:subtilisin family serine protease
LKEKLVKKLVWVTGGICLAAVGLARPVWTQESLSIGVAGIDAQRLHELPYNLIGRKIAIGQVEIGRPGKFGLDKAVSKQPAIAPAGVFLRNGAAKANTNIDPHAQNVASIMISDRKTLAGIAPGARLYSTAVGSVKYAGQPEECLSAQSTANRNSGDVRAINFSFGETLERDPRPEARLDGNSLLTRCLDWSSRVHDVLYVIAGNQGKGGIPIPTDNYNGMNIAFSSRQDGIFRKVDVTNLSAAGGGVKGRLRGREMNLGTRQSISLVAPGNRVYALNPDAKVKEVTGTSFAAPHVTATVALLQEYGDKQIKMAIASRPPFQGGLGGSTRNWSLDARRHQVMKAVLLNSADKVQDAGDGLRLGMSKTIIDKQNRNWVDSDAYRQPKVSLNSEIGAGQLNAFRAYEQFKAGQWQSWQPVPAMGWNYRQLKANSAEDYVLAAPLKQGSYVAITLVWERLVELRDKNQNGSFDVGEDFRDRGLNNLDLYLLNADSNAAASNICTSTSEVDSIEHIFCPVPTTGSYKIRVQFRQQVNQPSQPYAIAWWTVPAQ